MTSFSSMYHGGIVACEANHGESFKQHCAFRETF